MTNPNPNNIDYNSLHVGDLVTIHLNHYSGERGEPFNAYLVDVKHRDDYYSHGAQQSPLIFWKPREVDKDSFLQEGDNAFCDASFVTEVVARELWRTGPTRVENTLYDYRQASLKRGKYWSSWDMVYLRKGQHFVIFPLTLAEAILSGLPQYHVPYGLDATRFWAAWEQAGKPGFKSVYTLATGKFSKDYTARVAGESYPLSEMQEAFIHVKPFRKWLLKNVERIVRTRTKLRADAIASAKYEEESYYKDLVGTV